RSGPKSHGGSTMFGADMLSCGAEEWDHGRRDSLCWVPEQASGNKDNAGSPFQAWAGVYLLSAFSFSRLIWYINSEVDIALDEMLRLQEEGPTEQDVSTVLEIEQRAHENGLQVCLKVCFISIIAFSTLSVA
ncbi:mitochondrial-like-processing peptidase subunit beta, partial [Trifolium medium]|nr:mitochondrial-like-processing peptidase subunit beta [Trifolium medium]